MRLTIIFTLLIAITSLQCKSISNQSTPTPFTENQHYYEGDWELMEVKKSGKRIKAETLNDCGYKEVIHLKFQEDVLISNYKGAGMEGYNIGKSNHEFCSFDPETFESKVTYNGCYNTLVLSKQAPDEWYEIGEGILARYQVSMQSDSLLTLKTRKVYVAFEKVYDEKVYKRIKSQ